MMSFKIILTLMMASSFVLTNGAPQFGQLAAVHSTVQRHAGRIQHQPRPHQLLQGNPNGPLHNAGPGLNPSGGLQNPASGQNNPASALNNPASHLNNPSGPLHNPAANNPASPLQNSAAAFSSGAGAIAGAGSGGFF